MYTRDLVRRAAICAGNRMVSLTFDHGKKIVAATIPAANRKWASFRHDEAPVVCPRDVLAACDETAWALDSRPRDAPADNSAAALPID